MPSLDFEWQLPYRYDPHGRYGPFVTVGIVVGGKQQDLLCLIDTGAERTLLDGQYLRAVGMDIFQGAPRRVSGFLGSTAVVYEHAVTILLETLEIELPVLFSTQPLERAVLGRDILAEVQLGVCEGAGEVYLGPGR